MDSSIYTKSMKTHATGEEVPILRKMAEVYDTPSSMSLAFYTSKGGSANSVVHVPNTTKILIGHYNFIQEYDWTSHKDAETVYTIEDEDPNNVYMFTLMKDGRLLIADMNDVHTVDRKGNYRVMSRITNRQLGQDWPFWRSIKLIDNDNYFIGCSSTQIYKLDMRNRNAITQACTSIKAAARSYFWDMQVDEEGSRAWYSLEE